MAVVPSEGSRRGMGVNIPGADRLVWYFFRISGVALVVLALGHLFITHYANVPSETTFDFVSKRWANPLWRSFDWLLLLFALWHGTLGLRISITDYIRRDGWRVLASSANWIVAIVITVIGTITIITFDEEMSRTNSGPLSGELWIADVLGAALVVISVVTYVAVAVALVWIVKNLAAGHVPIYNGDTGQYAWIFHRMTGLGVLFFLLIHVIDIMLIGLGRDVYDHAVEFYARWYIIPMEVLLVGAVIYHALNGLRIIAIDFWSEGTRKERQMFWIALIGAAVLTIPSAIIIIIHEF
jgi:succinate dehydrogenase cytochrome b556 subunit/succinate dehydrogenase hydrophobic membrane anchor protein